MKRVLFKLFLLFLFSFALIIVSNAFATPMDNNVALMQLDDSNMSLALHTAYMKYKALAVAALVALMASFLFYTDIKKLFGGTENEAN